MSFVWSESPDERVWVVNRVKPRRANWKTWKHEKKPQRANGCARRHTRWHAQAAAKSRARTATTARAQASLRKTTAISRREKCRAVENKANKDKNTKTRTSESTARIPSRRRSKVYIRKRCGVVGLNNEKAMLSPRRAGVFDPQQKPQKQRQCGRFRTNQVRRQRGEGGAPRRPSPVTASQLQSTALAARIGAGSTTPARHLAQAPLTTLACQPCNAAHGTWKRTATGTQRSTGIGGPCTLAGTAHRQPPAQAPGQARQGRHGSAPAAGTALRSALTQSRTTATAWIADVAVAAAAAQRRKTIPCSCCICSPWWALGASSTYRASASSPWMAAATAAQRSWQPSQTTPPPQRRQQPGLRLRRGGKQAACCLWRHLGP